MRLLLDESVPRRLRRALPAHVVKTAVEMGWGGVKNGALMALAAAEFDAFVTVDQNLPYQHNVATLPIAVVVLVAHSNELHVLPSPCTAVGGSACDPAATNAGSDRGITSASTRTHNSGAAHRRCGPVMHVGRFLRSIADCDELTFSADGEVQRMGQCQTVQDGIRPAGRALPQER